MNAKKLCLAVLMMSMFLSFPVYATTYTSLHGADTGPTGNISLMSFTAPPYFRVLIPPGATYFSLSMICQGAANVTTVARFGQAPSGYLPLPSYSSSTSKSLDQARAGNILSGNSEGILNIASQYFHPQPLAESQAGWLYVDIVGSGVYHIDFDLSVNAAVYSEWYERSVGNIDCSCTQTGTCAMCPASSYPGTIKGTVTPNVIATITTSDTIGKVRGVATSLPNGNFLMGHDAGTFKLTAKADCYMTYTDSITVNPCPAGVCISSDKDYSTKIDIKLTSLDGCVRAGNDLSLKDICAEYKGVRYRFTLNLLNLSELTWKMDTSAYTQLLSDPGNCLKIGDDLALMLYAAYQGHNYGFTLNYDKDLIWKMDVGTFKSIN